MKLVRFNEYEFYDPFTDSEKVRLTATEDKGTWYADLPVDSRGSRRREFKERVKAEMVLDKVPGELAWN